MLRLIIGQRTATAAERPALFFLRGLFHHLYRGRVQLIGAALPVEGLIAASHHRNCGLGRGTRARLGDRARATYIGRTLPHSPKVRKLIN